MVLLVEVNELLSESPTVWIVNLSVYIYFV